MAAAPDKFKLGLEAIIAGFAGAFLYGVAYVCLSGEGADSIRLMWMAYALAFLAPLLIPLSFLAQATLVRYAKVGDTRFSLARSAALGALMGELLMLPGTAVHILRGDKEVEFEKAFDFLAFGVTSGLVPWCAAFFIAWASFKNARLKIARRQTAREEQSRLAESKAREAAKAPPPPPAKFRV